MNPIFELLEENDLIADADALKVFDYKADHLLRIYENLYKTVFEHQYDGFIEQKNFDPFTYVASASLRGSSSCWEVPCRIAKIDFLNRFAALYANQVAVPLVLSKPADVSKHPGEAARLLSHSLLGILRSRPLIEAGIVRPTVMMTSHCEHETEEIRKLANAAHDYAGSLAEEFLDDFEVVYQLPEKSPTGKSTVYLSGPSEFLEHDMVHLFEETSQWRLKSWRYDKEGRVEIGGRRKLACVQRIFRPIASSTTFYLAYGLQFRARFLSDLPGEVILLEDFAEENPKLIESTRAMKELTHTLPLLADLPLTKLLRIRNEDRESFAAYRFEITRITKEALENGISETEVRDTLRSRIEPKLNKIKQELQTERQKRINYLGWGTASLAASVGIGLCGLPMIAAAPLVATAAAVGTRLIGKGSEVAIEQTPETRKQNDLYFLARLLDEAK